MMRPIEPQDSPRSTQHSGGTGVGSIVIFLACGALLLLLLVSGPKRIIFVPLAISAFFLFLHAWGRYRAAKRSASPNPSGDEADFEMEVQLPAQPRIRGHTAEISHEMGLRRKLFDRFDLLAIQRTRELNLSREEAGRFLDLARGFVDMDHSTALLAEHDEVELTRHLTASIERALLTWDRSSTV